MLFGPAVCRKCSATHTTPAHRYILTPWCENPVVTAQNTRWTLAFLCPGWHWPAPDSAPFLSCVICDLGGPSGPVIVTNRLADLALEGLLERAVSSTYLGACCRPLGRLMPPPLVGRAVAVFFLILSPSPQQPSAAGAEARRRTGVVLLFVRRVHAPPPSAWLSPRPHFPSRVSFMRAFFRVMLCARAAAGGLRCVRGRQAKGRDARRGA